MTLRYLLIVALAFIPGLYGFSQSIPEQLKLAIVKLETDSQFKHAIIGFEVKESNGTSVFEHNAQTGLAPASTQKIFTSCASFELLGSGFRYRTRVDYALKKDSAAVLKIAASDDPSLGSFRFSSFGSEALLKALITVMHSRKINVLSRPLLFTVPDSGNQIPGGWIWEDIGNYYGAPAQGFNWMENQYDLSLQSGKIPGEAVTIKSIRPSDEVIPENSVLAAEEGSGDNTLIYPATGITPSRIEGTIPINEKDFVVSGSLASPRRTFEAQLITAALEAGIIIRDNSAGIKQQKTDSSLVFAELLTLVSPPFDSLNYWFLKKSVNLYGEAFIKTLAAKGGKFCSTADGVKVLKAFWIAHGIESSSINICDGSGLSPQNRVTPAALVQALLYAKSRPWFTTFFNALPEYNGMKMKSGSISGVRSYAGFQKSAKGKDYVFSIIVNNFDGSAAIALKKMYKLLDLLK